MARRSSPSIENEICARGMPLPDASVILPPKLANAGARVTVLSVLVEAKLELPTLSTAELAKTEARTTPFEPILLIATL